MIHPLFLDVFRFPEHVTGFHHRKMENAIRTSRRVSWRERVVALGECWDLAMKMDVSGEIIRTEPCSPEPWNHGLF
jgi:hypothetical protein